MSLDRFYGPLMFVTAIVTNAAVFSRIRRAGSNLARTSMCLASSGPPKAKKVPHNQLYGVNTRDPEEFRGPSPMDPPKEKEDPYHWLRDETRKDDKILDHLRAENAFCAADMKHLEPLRGALYKEMLSYLKETDENVPYPHGEFEYYSRTVQGLSYPIHCRKVKSAKGKSASADANANPEIVLLDENAVAEGKDYSDVSGVEPSPDHSLLVYGIDNSGYETYALTVKNIATGEFLADKVEETNGEVVWGADESAFFYLKLDSAHRPYQLYMHIMGTPQEEDVLLYQEDDELFWMGCDKTASDRFLVIGSGSSETSEIHVIDLHNVKGAQGHRDAVKNIQVVAPRKFGVRYDIEHKQSLPGSGQDDCFLVVTNIDGAKNRKLMSVGLDALGDAAKWADVKPYDPTVQVEDLLPFKEHLVITGREGGLSQVWVAHASDISNWQKVPFEEEAYNVWAGANFEFDSSKVRLGYSSLVTPKTTLDYDMSTGAKEILKVTDVPNYDASLYETKRINATVRDGTQVPMTMVYKKSAYASYHQKADGSHMPMPTLLYGYGSYGICIDPSFDYKRTAMLDRGVLFVIAHIRGGGEMGRQWYEDKGKYLNKLNTFTDFGDCAKHLVKENLTSKEHLSIVGRSAGGLLVGACVNMFPDLYKAAVADVPFVDVLNSMADPSIPLTVGEWEEWGNPNLEKYYKYMESYSPYDNVEKQAYPSMLVTAGLNDPRVAYWEPAKWVAKLRELKTDSNPLYFKTDLTSGHFSASDRYKYLKESAFEYAFILDQIGADVSCPETSET